MKAPALVAVDQGPEAFAALFAAADARGVRVGWLDLASEVEPPVELAAASGAWKAVSARAGRTISVKRTKGVPVLRDLLREQFLGCVAVLVRGHEGRPRLSADGGLFRLDFAADRTRRFGADELLAELARPRHRA